MYTWNFSAIWPYTGLLVDGLLGTLHIALVSLFFGVLVGALMAMLRMSSSALLRYPAMVFIGFYRNTPAIVHFFWFFYALPVLAPVSLSPFMAAVLALSIQSSAFYAEVLRGGIASMERGQWEGARALGMDQGRILRRIILPQALRRMLAPFLERSFELVKTTALASSLAYAELLYQAMQINTQTFRPLEVYSVIAVMYFSVLFIASLASQRLERHLARSV
ncbi:polar amino acid transport system permease protein [Pseudomonas flavescens]|uniref:Polar amino acid transport system permease protein n=1 Tax=Phytopseudomonas flavescens TaxID=29435 RepID=A0A1G8NNE3_9GAMM|nr:amino acid ABC transporter permease [Pseudomonas flavescens]SDI81718.1 polar amino acid transport system permease protein [Pseudomonas flavescens]